jgi:hypothetical protein
MEIGVLFLAVAVIILILILKFEKKQTKKINTILRISRSVPPMFMLKSTEQKISVLKAALRYDEVAQNMANAGSMADIYTNKNENYRQSKIQQYKLLSAKYNNGQMSLVAYNEKLDELLSHVHRHNASIEVAC